jgi:hypothetical protein
MTAQVAVLNLSGIAVASDTFVTSFTGGESKSMGNTEKIYELGPQHKVVVLHSGSIGINSIPHKLHIGEWARTLSIPLPTLQAYADSYRTWAASEKRMLESASESALIHFTLNEQYYEIAREMDNARDSLHFEEGTTERKKKLAIKGAFNKVISDYSAYLNSLEAYTGITEKSIMKSLSDNAIDLEGKIDYIFSRFALEDGETESLVALAAQVLLRIQPMAEDSELAFVGFGEEEPFGGVVRMSCRGIYAGSLIATTQEKFKVLPVHNASGISYFAQRDAMYGFINGYNTLIVNELKSLIEKKIEDQWGSTTDEPIGWQIASQIETDLQEYARKTFVSPMLTTIEAMGLNSMAALADSLVGLQAMRTYSQPGTATVGGLIEVATIDRINGVQWKRRLPFTSAD